MIVTKDVTLCAVTGTQTGSVTPLSRKDTGNSVENGFISENTQASERRRHVLPGLFSQEGENMVLFLSRSENTDAFQS